MLRSFQFVCVLFIFTNVIASAQPSRSHPSRNIGTLNQLRQRAPRLIWKSSLTGKQTVTIAGVGAGKIAVLAEPRPRMENGAYIAQLIQFMAFDVKSGSVAWRREILGGDITTVVDDSRLYMRLQLPVVSHNYYDFKDDDLKYEMLTFRWADGRMGWRIPCPSTGDMLAWNGRLFFDGRENHGTRNMLIAVDANTGKEQWRTMRSDINGLFAARDALYAYGDAHDPEGEYLSAINPATGLNMQILPYNPQFTVGTHLTVLEWLPKAQVLVGTVAKDMTPGSNFYQIRALKADGKLAWDRPDTSRFKVVSNVLVCENYNTGKGGYPHGLIGLDPATGHELWRRTAAIDYLGFYDINLGEWHGQAVVLLGRQLCGLNPRTGKTVWAIDALPIGEQSVVKQARIVGDVIVVAMGGIKDQPAQVRAYALK